MTFSGRERENLIQRAGKEVFDILVLGAGINGASIARSAALRGYSVALFDQQDFGAGTSSRSSRLIHGGLRYLEHAEFGLVFESLAERALLSKVARHIVRPLHFIFPIYRGDRLGLFTARLGVWLYDLLAMFRNYEHHTKLSPAQIREYLPLLRGDGLKGAVAYYDFRTDDARLVLENVLSAADVGAVTLSYARVDSIDAGGQTKLLSVHDLIGKRQFDVRGRAVVCAAGPWTDRVLHRDTPTRHWLTPTKGAHIVVPGDRLPVKSAVVMQHPEDGRVVFTLPYFEHTVIGTTDTFYGDDPTNVDTSADDVDYLLEVAAAYFPEARLTREHVISTWAGVRPLLRSDADDPSAVSREHRLQVRDDGVVVIAGGKLTTYRRIAEECVDATAQVVANAGGPAARAKALTKKRALPGAIDLDTDQELTELGERLGTALGDLEAGAHLALTYGMRSLELLELTKGHTELGQRIIDALPFIWAEMVYTARHEMALSLADVLIRRTQLFYRDVDQGLKVAPRVAQLMASEVGWDEQEVARQLEVYRAEVAASRAWRDGPSSSR